MGKKRAGHTPGKGNIGDSVEEGAADQHGAARPSVTVLLTQESFGVRIATTSVRTGLAMTGVLQEVRGVIQMGFSK